MQKAKERFGSLDNRCYRNKITLLSYILAIGIIYTHAVNYTIYGYTSGWYYWGGRFIGYASNWVPFFFLISGFLFYQNFSYSVLLKKWKTRFFSILIPYIIWNLTAFLYYSILAMIPVISNHLNGQIEPFTVEWIVKNALWGYHNALWFLRNLMVYIIICPIFYGLIKKWKLCGIIIIVFCSVQGFQGSGYLYYAVYYILGMFLGIHYKEPIQRQYKKRSSFLTLGIFFITLFFNIIVADEFPYFVQPLCCIQMVLLWIAADLLRTDKKLEWWKTISFFIYCTHGMVLESVEKIFLIVLGRNLISAVLDQIMAPFITLLIVTMAAWILRKNTMLWNVATGNRGSIG